MTDQTIQTTKTTKEVKARIGDLRISPRKVRIVTDLIKKKTVEEARTQLQFLTKKAAGPILKLLNSAVANAVNNFSLNPEKLRIKNITVDKGRVMMRYKPRAQGRVSPIRHRTSLVQLVLVEDAKIKTHAKKKRVTTADSLEKKTGVSKQEHAVEQQTEKERRPEEAKKRAEAPKKHKFKPVAKTGIKGRFSEVKKRLFHRKTNA